MAPLLRATISELDAELPVEGVGVASDAIAASIAEPRMRALLLNGFAIVALVLAALGVYGVASYSVAMRRRDIGVRMAFGAQRGEIFRLVLREGMSLVAAGTLLGLAGSLLVTRLLESQLFGISPADPVTFAGATVVLIAVAFLAHVVPARRATRLDPLRALRVE